MRTKLLMIFVSASVAMPGAIALIATTPKPMSVANGPSGSSEDKTHQVHCKDGTAVYNEKVYVGTNGAEVCDDKGGAPDGRVIMTPSYAAVDGDPSNGSYSSYGTGFIRVDSSGPSCGDSTHTDATKGKGGSCKP